MSVVVSLTLGEFMWVMKVRDKVEGIHVCDRGRRGEGVLSKFPDMDNKFG